MYDLEESWSPVQSFYVDVIETLQDYCFGQSAVQKWKWLTVTIIQL